MSDVVIEVGPAVVRGRGAVDSDLATAAMEYVDDDLGLLDDEVVPVDELWADLLTAAVGSDADGIVVVVPTWWPATRIDRVRAAAGRAAGEVEVLRRGPLLMGAADHDATAIVEIAADLVVVGKSAGCAVIPIIGAADDVAAGVRSAVGTPAAVLIDAPSTVDGAAVLGASIADRLCADGIPAALVDDDAVVRAASSTPLDASAAAQHRPTTRPLPTLPILIGVVTAATVCAGLALRGDTDVRETTAMLVEGRIGVVVPARWPVQRITTGPGSARLQLLSPRQPGVALHLTQAATPSQADLAATAQTLRVALDAESSATFHEFNPADVRVGRPAVTYREVRHDRHVGWAVLVDRSVRIAIGCQSPPASEDLVREVCEQAIRSAHAVS